MEENFVNAGNARGVFMGSIVLANCRLGMKLESGSVSPPELGISRQLHVERAPPYRHDLKLILSEVCYKNSSDIQRAHKREQLSTRNPFQQPTI